MKFLRERVPWPFLIFLTACFVIVEGSPFRIDFVTRAEDLKRAEFFPFSSFPMYSDFSPSPNYVYVSRPDGTPLASMGDLAVLSSVLKKAYNKELRKLKASTGVPMKEMTPAQKRPAGDAILRLLHDEISPHVFAGGDFPHLRFHEVIIRQGQKEIESEDIIVGDVQF